MPGTGSASWEAVSALLDELLDADDPQRNARLRQLRIENPALCDQIETLLAQHAAVQAEQFLEGAAIDQFKFADLAGRTFAGYTLERSLGHGGMGSVWLARRSDGRYEGQAAVKLLNLGSLGRSVAERLRHEANALAKLSHPNITHLIDAGVADAQPYLILEYVEGEPIDRWCDARRLGIEARLRLFLQVLAAVSHAHGRLILHRDLKPSNILVTQDGTAKLLDFGIAKLLEGEGRTTPPSELTRLGGSAMTPEYAAPEQLQRADVTTATDVYALGVLLYVLLVGRHPTASPTGTPIEQMRALVETEPKRLSDAALDDYADIAQLRGMSQLQLARVLRGDLDNIIAKALKKAPAERYGTVDAFARDIQNYLNDEPVTARADSRAYRLGKFVRRHRFAVAAVSLIALVLVAGIAGTTWQALEARRQRAEATAQARESARQRDAARYQAQRAEASSEFMSLMLEEVGPGGQPLTPIELVDRGVQLLDKRYGEDPQFAARMLLQMSRRYMDLGNTQKQSQVLARALAIAQEQNNPDLDAMSRAQRLNEGKPVNPAYVVSYSIILNRLGRTDEAIERLRSASRDLHAAGNTTWALNADYHLARALMLSGKHAQSLKLLAAVRDAWSQNATANKDRLADLSRTLAEIELARGRLKEAKELIDASLEQFGYPEAQPALNLTAALTTAARISSGLKQQQEAEAFARAALKISEGIAREPSQSADVGEALLALASVHRAKRDASAALDAAKQAVEALSNGLGQTHPLTQQAVRL